jgi:hypothetical protein
LLYAISILSLRHDLTDAPCFLRIDYFLRLHYDSCHTPLRHAFSASHFAIAPQLRSFDAEAFAAELFSFLSSITPFRYFAIFAFAYIFSPQLSLSQTLLFSPDYIDISISLFRRHAITPFQHY